MKKDSIIKIDNEGFDIDLMRNINIDKDKRMTAFEKGKLLNVLEGAIHDKKRELDIFRCQAQEQALEKIRPTSWNTIKDQITKLELKKSIIEKEIQQKGAEILTTGFKLSGKLIEFGTDLKDGKETRRQTMPGHRKQELKTKGLSHLEIKQTEEAVVKYRTALEAALKIFDEMTTDKNKIMTKFLLCETKGDAINIMKAVLRNGDKILGG